MSPHFVDGEGHDYGMSSTSPCLALVGDVQAAVDGVRPVQPDPATILATHTALAEAAGR